MFHKAQAGRIHADAVRLRRACRCNSAPVDTGLVRRNDRQNRHSRKKVFAPQTGQRMDNLGTNQPPA